MPLVRSHCPTSTVRRKTGIQRLGRRRSATTETTIASTTTNHVSPSCVISVSPRSDDGPCVVRAPLSDARVEVDKP